MNGIEELFREVIACQACASADCPKLLRDDIENVPQPGFVGKNYHSHRVLLVGQNPGTPPDRLLAEDMTYTNALRQLRDSPSKQNYDQLARVLQQFVPSWPVHGTYFPLNECGLSLEDIAYCNLVRCRTVLNAAPPMLSVAQCVNLHFERWLDFLKPRVVVFIGLWAFQKGGEAVRKRGLACDYINRDRSLNREARRQNREQVATLVQAHQ